MTIQRLDLSAYRSFRKLTWRPGELNVVTGDEGGRRDLLRALSLISAAAQSWPDFTGAFMKGVGSHEDNFHGDEPELFWNLECLPQRGDTQGFAYELCLERYDGDPGWGIVFERVRRADDFQEHEVMVREGATATWQPARPRIPRHPGERPPRPQTASIASDMSALVVWSKFREDKRVAPYADGLAGWGLFAELAAGPGAPARRALVPKGFHDQLWRDGGNLVNLLYSVDDVEELRAKLDAALASAFEGYAGLAFPSPDPFQMGLAVRWKDRPPTPLVELPDEVVRALLVLGALLAPALPELTWLESPEVGLPPALLPTVAALADEAAARGQVVLSTASPELLAALAPREPDVFVARALENGARALAPEKG